MKKLTQFKIISLIVGYGLGINSGVENFLSHYDCSNPVGIRDMAFFLMCFSFFFQKFRYKKLTELEFLSPIVWCCHGTLRSCKPSVRV